MTFFGRVSVHEYLHWVRSTDEAEAALHEARLRYIAVKKKRCGQQPQPPDDPTSDVVVYRTIDFGDNEDKEPQY